MLATKAVFGMKVCNHDHGLTEFLATNPFITIDQGKLKGLIFAQQEHPLTCEEIQSLYRTYYIPGIDSFIISLLRVLPKRLKNLPLPNPHKDYTLTV